MTVEVPSPRENPDLIGHEAAEKTMLDSFNSGRLHHAWLITGPKGIGKATLAYRFARFLLTQEEEGADGGMFGDALPKENPDSLYLAPDSPTFHRIASHGHGDLMSIERIMDEKKGKRQSQIVVDGVRGIGRFLSMTASEGGWRVVIIDAADEMNRNAANAVLKVLEEPPKRAILLLVCHNPGRLLPTIKSRCRKLTLKPLETEDNINLIQRYSPETSVEDATVLAEISQGSLGYALALVKEGGLEYFKDLMGLLETLPMLSTSKLHSFADKLARKGAEDSFRTFTDLLRWWLGRLIRSAARGEGGVNPISEQENQLISKILNATSLDRLLEVWEKIDHLFTRAGGGNDLDRKQVVLNAFLSLEDATRSR
ncbi:MAG: DNA polymerase III subunit delta' [Rhodospirillales bacterium]|nr:DNA polymerase III subunit delta' [Rhodospirillales bacterium]